ncbi:hypothetical protein YYC_05512 [Plasmodium yoelii 17X]|uniref:Uncharacterized protein n=1 Tax=Plasmodium yoelii 17X TaxID=1323249 RepID=V7PBB2_PLAYE|nr:hypothetical protein YYC_05512 [Plasmodium yoelii 17X]
MMLHNLHITNQIKLKWIIAWYVFFLIKYSFHNIFRYYCGRFNTLRAFYSDELDKSPSIKFHNNGKIKNYCPIEDSGNQECKTDLDKIKAVFLWLFEQNIISRISNLSEDQPKVFITYIIIWLNYILRLKNVNDFKNISEIYEANIKNNTDYINHDTCAKDCNIILKEKTEYTDFKELIEKNECLMNISINDISKFYDAFKILCNMYIDYNGNSSNCEKCSENAIQFVKKYNDLNKDSGITEDSPYYQALSTLSTDYNNLKDKCNDISPFPSIETIKIHVKGSEQKIEQTPAPNSEATAQSPSIGNKLFIVLSIFAAIPFFLGIAYKVNNIIFKNYFHYIYVKVNK